MQHKQEGNTVLHFNKTKMHTWEEKHASMHNAYEFRSKKTMHMSISDINPNIKNLNSILKNRHLKEEHITNTNERI